MNRQSFLTLSSGIALAIGSLALCFPETLLTAKGVAPSAALAVWMREVGVLILTSGVATLLARRAPDSTALRGLLIGNALLHLALLPIELLAFAEGVITELAGVAPNSVLHVVLGSCFIAYARRIPGAARLE